MLSDFLNTHFPTAEARAGLANRRSYLAALPDIDLTSTPLLRIAIDTLCFAHIGSKTGDMRLVRESQASYGKVLNSLIKATSAPAGEVPYMEPKAVITSIMLLCLYDDSIPVPHQEGGWGTHYWGAQQLLRAYGASFLNMAEPFDRLIFWNLRMPTLFAGVARRKAIILGEPQWLALAEANVESRGPLTDFYRIVMQIPALLERTDNMMAAETDPTETEAICTDICKIRQDVKDWYEEKTRRTHGNYLEVPVTFTTEEEPNAFDMEIEEHCFMTTSDTFTTFFRFRTPGYLVKNHTYDILMGLLLDCTLLRLLHFQPESASFLKDLSPDEVERSAYDNARNLCRSIHHYSNFLSLPYVDFTDFLLDMAQNFFEEVGALKELGWCQAVRCATDLRRTRIKNTIQPRTLCRMGDAGPGFAAATRFRTRNIAQG
ncbi:hypothetical protein M409DRAFT_25982 [Zasmidium cellare ATCC 36951]|uniref:Transcription factor domain-containing protein n=1 Tax=Zasmidium cellare ATCC 36951 TaxID=1080233 RepID=A0A6A6C9T2_ZASCE|nr:uncharacterized protein M409DRAFT_25982 [Zasmidium cellare ATCC 36951]KAF2163801.1 hypothetical protein M409DRAFT_25982 [Zasmidium cellare ATCC 36951]